MTRRATVALALSAGFLVPAAAHAADPVTLDATTPVDVSAYGNTLAWLRPTDSKRTHAQLVVRDPDGTVRVVARALPAYTNDLVIGRSSSGASIAIVATVSTHGGIPVRSTPARKGALYSLPLDGSAAPARLPVSKPGTDLAAPGLLRGRLSFAKRESLQGRTRWTVRRGTVRSSFSSILSRGYADSTIPQTTPTAGGRVAYVVSTHDPVSTGASVVLRQLRPGGHSIVLSRTFYGGASDSGFGPLTPSAEGGRLTASRWTVAGAHPHDLSTWALPGGKLVTTAKSAVATEESVPVAGGGAATGTGTATFAPQGTVGGLVLTPAG